MVTLMLHSAKLKVEGRRHNTYTDSIAFVQRALLFDFVQFHVDLFAEDGDGVSTQSRHNHSAQVSHVVVLPERGDSTSNAVLSIAVPRHHTRNRRRCRAPCHLDLNDAVSPCAISLESQATHVFPEFQEVFFFFFFASTQAFYHTSRRMLLTLASSTTTSIPKDCNCLAAAKPEIPAPIMTTLPNFFTEIIH